MADERRFPNPRIVPLDPSGFDHTWQDAPLLLATLDGAHIGIWYWNLDSGELHVSPCARTLFGLDGLAQPGAVDYLRQVPEEEQAEVRAIFQALADGSVLSYRHRMRRADGGLYWLELGGSLRQREDGSRLLLGVCRGIDEQQAREEALVSSEQRFSSLFEMSPDAIFLVNYPDGLLIETNQQFKTLFGWSREQTRNRTTQDIQLWVNLAQRDFVIRCVSLTAAPVTQEVQLRTRDGRVLDGTLSCKHLDLHGEAFLLCTFLDTSERKRAEAALRASESKFANAFLSSPDAVVITDLISGRFVEINPGFERQFGWSKAEAIGRTSMELGIWSDLCDRQRMLEALEQGNFRDLEANLYHRDGRRSINLLYGGKIELEGQRCLVLTVRDITRQREQEQALKISQERLHLALESAALGTWNWHIPSDALYGSARAAALHGLADEPYQGNFQHFFGSVYLDDRNKIRKTYRALLASRRTEYQNVYRTRLADGRLRYLENTARLYRDELGNPLRMAGILVDITDRVEREQRLAASEEKFATLFQASPDPICVTRVHEGTFVEINPSFTATFGWKPEDATGKTAEQLNFWADAQQNSRLNERLQEERELTNTEAHFRTRTGQELTCVLSSRFIQVEGEPCITTTFRDISKRKRAEAALQASEEKFAKAFHSSPDAITISERDSGRYIEVNEGFTRLTGYRAEEVIGRSVFDLNIWASPVEREAMVETLKRDGRVKHMELRGLHRNGQIMTFEVSVEPIELNGTPCLLLNARDISQLKAAQAQVQHLAYHDSLTNLPNRALLMDRLKQQIALLRRHGLRGALMFIDLDHFKHINDSLGHPVGDAVLKMITARLEASTRQEDTVARLGGDEFVVLLSGLEGERGEVTRRVRQIAEKLRRLLADPMLLDGQRLQVTPSIGIALIPDHGNTAADLLKRADIALYKAKDSGRNAIQLFRSSMQEAASERLRLENDLRLAQMRNEFELHFQPQVDARSGRIIGAEALLRWQHPTLGPRAPGQFMRVLEESGLIYEVGGWVLQRACEVCAELLRDGLVTPDSFSLCVNISPRQFGHSDFVARVERCLEHSRLPQAMLKLEITESIVIQNIEDTIGKMLRLKRLGLSFAMDDFGTGYSSLTYLKRLPVDMLKIDQSFVRDAVNNPNDAEIVRAIIAMARALGLDIIAEGVEHDDQLQFLQRQDCHLYQGYLFSQPLALQQFRRLLGDAPPATESQA
ncbi:PAS domain S-box protein [Pseudomonas sp.]|uniref:PAS domain S-box protein n=1 Tax=Pseudomonas sp. TaxID=306 RepID=UPI0028A93599|nr:PAS domain S-box protein [Pseudomonas sp.]